VKLTFFTPRVELKQLVKAIWAFESPVGLPASDASIAAPNGCPKLIVSCRNAIIARVESSVQSIKDHDEYFLGIRDVPVSLHTGSGATSFIGIEFFPHGAFPILKVPLVELTNRLLPASELLKDWGPSVAEAVARLDSVEERVDFIQELLFVKLKESAPANSIVEYCVRFLDRTAGLAPLSELERKTGYSKRYLEMLFKQHVGISPKTLAGIFRFQRFYRKWALGQSYGELTADMYSYYYDQAHFAKDFKKMTGSSPGRFVSGVSNSFGRKLTATQPL